MALSGLSTMGKSSCGRRWSGWDGRGRWRGGGDDGVAGEGVLRVCDVIGELSKPRCRCVLVLEQFRTNPTL